MQKTTKNGQVFDLTHMLPTSIDLTLVIDEVTYAFKAKITFSSHCYTNSTPDENHPLFLHTDGTGHRYLCEERLALSKQLPQAIEALFQDNKSCYRLKDAGNFVRIGYTTAKEKFSGLYLFFSYENSRDVDYLLRINIGSFHNRTNRPGNIRSESLVRVKDLLREWILKRDVIKNQLVEAKK